LINRAPNTLQGDPPVTGLGCALALITVLTSRRNGVMFWG